MQIGKLKEEMPYKERQWPWGKMLKYITARQAQDRLDDICWPENWKVEYREIAGNIFAWVSIKVFNENISWTKTEAMYPSYEWITKWDAGSESSIEKEKWHISDSFKRACVCWGVGRFLYWETGEEPDKTDEKPWFNNPELESFKKKKDNYKNADEALKVINKHYKIGRPMEETIILLYANA
jgi:hypothetical protein